MYTYLKWQLYDFDNGRLADVEKIDFEDVEIILGGLGGSDGKTCSSAVATKLTDSCNHSLQVWSCRPEAPRSPTITGLHAKYLQHSALSQPAERSICK